MTAATPHSPVSAGGSGFVDGGRRHPGGAALRPAASRAVPTTEHPP